MNRSSPYTYYIIRYVCTHDIKPALNRQPLHLLTEGYEDHQIILTSTATPIFSLEQKRFNQITNMMPMCLLLFIVGFHLLDYIFIY